MIRTRAPVHSAAPPAAARPGASAYFILIVILIDSIGFGIVLPVVPGIVMKLGHVDLPTATRIGGWLGVVYAAVQFLSGPLVGNLGDRFGRRPVLLGSLAGFTIDYLLLGFAPSLTWLFIGRAFAGFFGASFGPAGAALADVSAPQERARYFGMMGAAFGIGFIVGPAIGGLLGELGARAPFYAAAVLTAANFLFGAFVFRETLAPENRRPFLWSRANPVGAFHALRKLRGVVPLLAAAFFWNLAAMIYPTIWSFFAIAAFGWGPGTIGASLALVGGLMVASQILIVGRIVKALGERRAAALGMTAAAFGFLAYTMVHSSVLAFAVLGVQLVSACAMPAISGLISRHVPANAQGELQGFNGSLNSIAAIIAPALYSAILAYFTGPSAPFRFVGASFVIAIAFVLVALAILLGSSKAQAEGEDQIPPATPS
ncbi:TCR/Tet family MFS transporter [Sphingomonas bacterium]|uniref:TCR/Tet family MFS transporter n=1 Tax=Sphingomonas bacterium TaxID=1895847 RepID=UPI0015770CE0|nr:TCR/Tet family MFS transporter [Sphingomonas bacterium]